MELLFYKDLIINFISQNIKLKEHQSLIRKVFDNENSVFLYSKKFFQFLADELGEEYEEEFKNLVKKFGDSGENIRSSETTETFEEEFLHIYENSSKNVLISISYSEPSQSILQKIPNIAIVSNCKKPNYHWLVTQIAILHPNTVTVNWFDFQNDDEIKKFFDDVFKIPKLISRINIFDRETRQFGHNRFDFFRKKVSVFYYTFHHRDFLSDEPSIKLAFRKVRIQTTRNKTDIHGRRLIFEGFILSADHAFNEIVLGGDWKIDIQFSYSEATKWMSRCSKFR